MNAFLDLVVVEQKRDPYLLQKKTSKGAISKVMKEIAG